MQDDIIKYIKTVELTLPKKQAEICRYICEHPFEVSALTAGELAAHLNLGTATITRLISRLGFSNYPDFRRALKKSSIFNLRDSYPQYWDARLQMLATEHNNQEKIYHTVLNQMTQWMQRLNSDAFFSKLDQCVEMILSARRIGVVGFRSARPLALTFTYSLHNSMDNIISLCEDPEYAYDTVADMGDKDLAVLYATLPYAKKTGNIARLCKKRGIPSILITTNSEESHPLSRISTLVLAAGEGAELSTYLPQLIITELITKRINVQLAESSRQKLQSLDQLLLESGLTLWETNDG